MIEDSPSQLEKLLLILFIIAVVLGNICVWITFFIQADYQYWPNLFILAMASLDLLIGSAILPLRYISIYSRPISVPSCLALYISDGCIVPAILYTMLWMMITRLFSLHHGSMVIRRRYLIGVLAFSWLGLYLLYCIPYVVIYQSYKNHPFPSDLEDALHCIKYTECIYRPSWLAYTEVGFSYGFPAGLIIIGLALHLFQLCRKRTNPVATAHGRKSQQQLTRQVFVLGLVLILLYLPWIILRTLMVFSDDAQLRRALKVTHYILLIKSALFPILYAATNASFRVSFAIYRHRRIIPNNHF